jgi:hypothetical protein
MVWLTILLGVLLLLALGAGAIYYLPYSRSPEKRWRDRVWQLLAAARQWEAIERSRLKALQSRRQAEERTLRDRAYIAFLHSIPADQLEEYPGIGPRTIEKLVHAGYTSLAVMQNARLRIPDLGEKRTGDVRSAIRDLTKQAKARFDAGQWPQANELADQLQALAAQEEERELPAQRRVQALGKVLEQLTEPIPIAQQITLRNYWRARSDPRLFPKIPLAPLPDLLQALAVADAEARTMLAARKKALPDPALPAAIPVNPPPPVPPTAASEPKSAPPPSREQQLAALEIDPALPLSADLVRRQYNLLWDRYDPAKVETLGADFVTLAERKRDAVRTAAIALIAPWNEPLAKEVPDAAPRDLRENPDLDALFGA